MNWGSPRKNTENILFNLGRKVGSGLLTFVHSPSMKLGICNPRKKEKKKESSLDG